MTILSSGAFFKASIILYLLASVTALILMRRQKACNISSQALCITAALFGAAASVMQILNTSGQISISLFQSNLPFLDISLKVDELSAYFLLALSVIVICVSIYSLGFISHYVGKRNVGLFNILYSFFILSMLLVLTSSNAIFFYISWEAMSLISYFLVVFEADKKENLSAGTLYIIMTHIAAAFLLIGFMIMYSYTKSFDIFGQSDTIPELAKNIMFILFLIGFGTKFAVIPFHIWLPYAYPAAPSNVTALMSGIMSKTAIYGLIRFVLCYLGVEATWWGMLILILGAVSAVLGVAYALVQTNVKRLLAFSSVENIGIILIGLGVCFIAAIQNNVLLEGFALTAALLHTFSHTLFKGGLFLGAGSIQYAVNTTDMNSLGGLIKRMPVTTVLILGFSLAISAIMPFNGFIGEWLTFQSLFASMTAGQAALNIVSILAVAALGMTGALAVAAFVKFFGISFLGLPRSTQAAEAKEVPAAMLVGMGILAVLCLVIGLFPSIMLKFIDNIVFSVTGYSITSQLKLTSFIANYPLRPLGSSISALEVLSIIIVVILFALITLRLIGGKLIKRQYGTWDCGFEALNSRMQYSATGYSKPLKIVFKILFRPTRKTTTSGEFTYHPQTIDYTTTTYSFFEKKIYEPIYQKIKYLSRKVKFTVQTGSIHNYLIYILVIVLVLMAYNRFV